MHITTSLKKTLFIVLFTQFQIPLIYCQDNILQLIDIIDKSENLIQSSKGSFIYEWINVDSLSAKKPNISENGMSGVTRVQPVYYEKYKIKYLSSRMKKNIKVYNIGVDNPVETWAYNIEKTEQYNLVKSSNNLYTPNGIIYSGARYPKQYDILSIYKLNVSPILKGALIGNFNNIELKLIKEIQEDMIEGIQCKGISVIITYSDRYVSKDTFWFAPSLDYKLVKYEIRLNDTNDLLDETIFKYKKYNSIYFPSNIIECSYRYNNNKRILRTNTIITMNDDWVFNVDLNVNQFENIYPKGMSVFDNRINKSITIQ